MEHKVVKCTNSKCGLYFGHTEKSTKCPFCKTEYGEKKVEEKPASSTEASAAKKDKKWTTKTQKDSFKIWKDK